MYKYLALVGLFLVLFSGQANAIDVEGAEGEWKTVSFDYNVPDSCIESFYINDANFFDTTSTRYRDSQETVDVIIQIPDIGLGDYNFDVFVSGNCTGVGYPTTLGEIDVTIINAPAGGGEVMFVSLDPIPDGNTMYSDNKPFSFTVDITSTRYELDLDGCNADTLNIPFFKNRSTTCQGCQITFEAEKPDKTASTDYAILNAYSDCYEYSLDSETTKTNSGECTEISIQPIGTATRGQSLLITTKDQNGKAISANLILTDSTPETTDQTLITNQPWPGIGSVLVDKAAIEPITILARNEELDCEGQRIITTLQGQLITPEEDKNTNQLVINGLPSESHIGTLINGTVVDGEGNLITNKNEIVKIKNPSGSSLKTNTDQSGMFKFYGGELGDYIIHASYSGYTSSDNITVNVRNPRKDLTPLVTINNKQPVDNLLYTDQTIDVGLYENCDSSNNACTRIDETMTGTITNGASASKVTFTNGWTSYTPTNEGQLTITIDKSNNYLEATKNYRVLAGFDMMFVGSIVFFIIAAVVVLALVLKIKGRGGGENIGQEGFDLPGPGE